MVTITLPSLPLELLTCSILPLLDNISLSKLSQTCTTMQSVVSDYLLNSKTLDMSDVIKWIEEGERIANIRWKENLTSFYTTGKYLYDRKDAFYGDRRKLAFMFLTRNYSVAKLKKLRMSGHPYDKEPMVKLQTIKKLIKQNRGLEELSLINTKLTNPLLDVISDLPKLDYLNLTQTPGGKPSKTKCNKAKFDAMMKEKGFNLYLEN